MREYTLEIDLSGTRDSESEPRYGTVEIAAQQEQSSSDGPSSLKISLLDGDAVIEESFAGELRAAWFRSMRDCPQTGRGCSRSYKLRFELVRGESAHATVLARAQLQGPPGEAGAPPEGMSLAVTVGE